MADSGYVGEPSYPNQDDIEEIKNASLSEKHR